MREDEAGRPIGDPDGRAGGQGFPASGEAIPERIQPVAERAAQGPAVPGSEVRRDPGSIRAEDTEPYVGLQYIARLFKIVALIVLVAIFAEVVAGLMFEASSESQAWPELVLNLMAEVIQGGVLSAMLWGAGDLTLLLIDVGHDVRAGRVLLGRMSARMGAADFAPRRRERGGEPPAADLPPRPTGDPRSR
jgi:hypothetical protein